MGFGFGYNINFHQSSPAARKPFLRRLIMKRKFRKFFYKRGEVQLKIIKNPFQGQPPGNKRELGEKHGNIRPSEQIGLDYMIETDGFFSPEGAINDFHQTGFSFSVPSKKPGYFA